MRRREELRLDGGGRNDRGMLEGRGIGRERGVGVWGFGGIWDGVEGGNKDGWKWRGGIGMSRVWGVGIMPRTC